MNIKLRLMGMLKDKEPADNSLQVADGSTIQAVLISLDIDPESVHVFTVNGTLERDKQFQLSPDDDLTVFPPVGGG